MTSNIYNNVMDKMERVFYAVKSLQDNKLACVMDEDRDAFFKICEAFGLIPCGGAFVFYEEQVCGQWFYIQ